LHTLALKNINPCRSFLATQVFVPQLSLITTIITGNHHQPPILKHQVGIHKHSQDALFIVSFIILCLSLDDIEFSLAEAASTRALPGISRLGSGYLDTHPYLPANASPR
jgi:hypothetical protein